MRPNSSVKSVVIKKTEGEWEVIEKKIECLGRKNLSNFLRCEIIKLNRRFTECPNCVSPSSGEKVTKRPYIPITVYKDLEKIAIKMQVPVTVVIDRLIITPILFSND
jgi:hypothetical protein